MDIYIKLFEVLFPVFFIVGIGYFLGKKDPKIDTNFITKFTANVGFPGLVFYSLTGTGLTFNEFQSFFIYGIILISSFSFIGIIFLFFLKKDLIRNLPPYILPNTNLEKYMCSLASIILGNSIDLSFLNVIFLIQYLLHNFHCLHYFL